MCRFEAEKLYARKAELEAAGVRVVVLVKEILDNEVEEFKKAVWPTGDIFLDKDLSFYKLLFGGQPGQESLAGFLCTLLCLCGGAGRRLRGHISAAKSQQEGNMKGEGLIKGGLLVVRKGGKLEYAFAESEVGEHAPVDEVVAAGKRAAIG